MRDNSAITAVAATPAGESWTAKPLLSRAAAPIHASVEPSVAKKAKLQTNGDPALIC